MSANRKSYMPCRLAQQRMTLSDLECHRALSLFLVSCSACVLVYSVQAWSTAKTTQGTDPRWRRPSLDDVTNFRYGRHVGSWTSGLDYCNAAVTGNYCKMATCIMYTVSQKIVHQCQPTTAFFRATNIWRNATYLQSDEKVVHFTR